LPLRTLPGVVRQIDAGRFRFGTLGYRLVVIRNCEHSLSRRRIIHLRGHLASLTDAFKPVFSCPCAVSSPGAHERFRTGAAPREGLTQPAGPQCAARAAGKKARCYSYPVFGGARRAISASRSRTTFASVRLRSTTLRPRRTAGHLNPDIGRSRPQSLPRRHEIRFA
jgi:hypothetical protein